jgi:polysaccharide pyruvyl transferase WcaK-like protein
MNTSETVDRSAKREPLSDLSRIRRPFAPTRRKSKRIALFGHFGWGNFGNESTFQAMLAYLRHLEPDAEINCICSGPAKVAMTYGIKAEPSRSAIVKPWTSKNAAVKWGRRLIIGVPSEIYRWLKSVARLWGTEALIVPGTGVLTDAYTLLNWGPYDMFRWSVAAKVCRSKLLFVSIGAGPIYSRAGKFFAKAALSLADFRSYRDESTLKYLQNIGFRTGDDPVYPDLAFSLPEDLAPCGDKKEGRRLVVGLGLMEYAGKYSVERPTDATYSAYLETLAEFVKWLLARDYDVRLLIGDLVDVPVKQEFRSLLEQRFVTYEEGRIIDEPVASVDDLLKQIAATDFVVATRFHNVLLSLLLNKPSIAISFHHKCSSLMSQMGLSEYCQDINRLNADRLVEQFCDLEKNAETLKPLIKNKAEEFRRALDEQYERIFRVLRPDCQNDGDSLKAMTTQ